jgi:hypothetical protein
MTLRVVMHCREAELEAMTVAELKSVCGELNLSVSGAKGDLIRRISAASAQEGAPDGSDLAGTDYRSLTVKELRALLQERQLIAPSKKADMIAALEANHEGGAVVEDEEAAPDSEELYKSMKVAELKAMAKERGLTVPPRKAEVIAKLVAFDAGELASEPDKQTTRRSRKGSGARNIAQGTEGMIVLVSAHDAYRRGCYRMMHDFLVP